MGRAARRAARAAPPPARAVRQPAVAGRRRRVAAHRERLQAYAEKAAREAGERDRLVGSGRRLRGALRAAVDAAFDDAGGRTADRRTSSPRSTPSGGPIRSRAKLVQLTVPGVPDVYQGTELWERSLRRPRQPAAGRLRRARRMLAGSMPRSTRATCPRVDARRAAKLLVTSRALRLRRDRPELFTRYTPMTVVGRGRRARDRASIAAGALTVATRLPGGLAAARRVAGHRRSLRPLPDRRRMP